MQDKKKVFYAFVADNTTNIKVGVGYTWVDKPSQVLYLHHNGEDTPVSETIYSSNGYLSTFDQHIYFCNTTLKGMKENVRAYLIRQIKLAKADAERYNTRINSLDISYNNFLNDKGAEPING